MKAGLRVLSLIAATTGAAMAGEESLTLDLAGPFERNRVIYSCENGASPSVEYINSAGSSIALIEIEDEPRLFVNVISASGAKYVSGPYVWWTKGERAEFFGELAPGGASSISCQAGKAALDRTIQ